MNDSSGASGGSNGGGGSYNAGGSPSNQADVGTGNGVVVIDDLQPI